MEELGHSRMLILKILRQAAFAPTWDGATPVIHAATTPLKRNEDKTPLRFFARGVFASWLVSWNFLDLPS